MGNVNCSPDECLVPIDCIGNTAWIFIVAGLLIAFINITLFVYLTHRLLMNQSKLDNKYKILIVLCHISYVIASITCALQMYYVALCTWYRIELILWQISYFVVLIGSCILLIIFLEKLYDAMKNTMWQLNNKFKLFIFFMILVQILGNILLVIWNDWWYISGWKKYSWVIIYYTTYVLYFVTTVGILLVFTSKFRAVASNIKHKNQQKHLIHIVAKQMMLVLISQMTSIVFRLTWLMNDHGVKYAFYICMNLLCIDILINCICLHAYFQHGYNLFTFFACKKCTNKLIEMNIKPLKLVINDDHVQINENQK